MNREFDAIVVGGGLAGLTSAAYLSRYGHRVLLCEKGKKTGGLVSTFWHRGFAFDAGIRAFENSGILFPMLKSLGIDLDFAPNPVSIGIGKRRISLDTRGSLQRYADMLTASFPKNASDVSRISAEIEKVMGYMDVLYGIDNPLFLDNMRDPEYLSKTLLPWLLRYQVNIRRASRLNDPIYTHLAHLTQNAALIDMVAQHFFKNTPAFFALSYFGLYLDYCYPMGGTGALAQRLTEYVLGAGGEILTESPVGMVDAQKHEIGLAGGQTLGYKKLIWAADQKMLYTLTKDCCGKGAEKRRRAVQKGSGGDSVLTLFMGVNLEHGYFSDRCGGHAFYTPDTQGLSSLPGWKNARGHGRGALLNWVGGYLERTTYEISCPALRDASLAPGGKTGVIISTLMDYELVRAFSDTGEYESFKHYCTEKITSVLEASLFGDIRRNTLFALCATPLTIERETGNTQGAITGWAFGSGELPAENRFRKITQAIKTPIRDIVQCGQWAFSPSGLPVSILTGKLAADAVHKTLKGKSSQHWPALNV